MRARVVTSLVAIAIGLGALGWQNPIVLATLCFLVAFRGLIELQRLFPWPGKSLLGWVIGILAAAGVIFTPLEFVPMVAVGLTLIGAAGLIVGAAREEVGWGSSLGALWLVAPIALFLRFHEYGDEQLWSLRPVILLIIPLWGGDSLALFLGKAYGKKPLAPKISPAKTWVGAYGHVLGCWIGAFLYCGLVGWPWWVALIAGLTASIVGQAGDLLQSYAKRAAGLKDSGQLLPGHGGLLDRLDSSLLSAPVTALVITSVFPVS